MKKYLLSCVFMAIMATIAICVSCNGQKDLTPPTIEESGFLPADCDIYYLGDTILVHFVCSDNVELGNFNIEIHNNFDHHSHGTSSVDCDEEGHDHEHEHVEGAWVYNQDYALARGLQQDTVNCKIAVPTDVLEGDYHFMLRLTDHAGWQAIKTVPIHLHEPGE